LLHSKKLTSFKSDLLGGKFFLHLRSIGRKTGGNAILAHNRFTALVQKYL